MTSSVAKNTAGVGVGVGGAACPRQGCPWSRDPPGGKHCAPRHGGDQFKLRRAGTVSLGGRWSGLQAAAASGRCPPTPARGRGNDGDTAPSDLAIVAMPAVKPDRFFRQHDLSYRVSLVSGELET